MRNFTNFAQTAGQAAARLHMAGQGVLRSFGQCVAQDLEKQVGNDIWHQYLPKSRGGCKNRRSLKSGDVQINFDFTIENAHSRAVEVFPTWGDQLSRSLSLQRLREISVKIWHANGGLEREISLDKNIYESFGTTNRRTVSRDWDAGKAFW